MTPGQFLLSLGTGPALVISYVGAAVGAVLVVMFAIAGIRRGIGFALYLAHSRSGGEWSAKGDEWMPSGPQPDHSDKLAGWEDELTPRW